MGAWGTGILDNDEAMDVYGAFFYHYDRKMTPAQAKEALIERYRPSEDLLQESDLWLALAHAEWECAALSAETLQMVERIVEGDIERSRWEEQWPPRQAALREFLKALRSPPKKKRRRRKPKYFFPPFPKGACLAFQRPGGSWGGAVCLDNTGDDAPVEIPTVLVAPVSIPEGSRPALDDFPAARLLAAPRIFHGGRDLHTWCKNHERIEVIGQLQVSKRFDPFLYAAAIWDPLVEVKARAGLPDLTVQELITDPESEELRAIGRLFVGSGFQRSGSAEFRHESARQRRQRYTEFLVQHGWIDQGATYSEVVDTRRWSKLTRFMERYCCYIEGQPPYDKLARPVQRFLEEDS